MIEIGVRKPLEHEVAGRVRVENTVVHISARQLQEEFEIVIGNVCGESAIPRASRILLESTGTLVVLNRLLLEGEPSDRAAKRTAQKNLAVAAIRDGVAGIRIGHRSLDAEIVQRVIFGAGRARASAPAN